MCTLTEEREAATAALSACALVFPPLGRPVPAGGKDFPLMGSLLRQKPSKMPASRIDRTHPTARQAAAEELAPLNRPAELASQQGVRGARHPAGRHGGGMRWPVNGKCSQVHNSA
jgi:hypothetical protein